MVGLQHGRVVAAVEKEVSTDLNRVSIGIKTFLRDEHLWNTVTAIEETMPEAQMIIADCGEPNLFKDFVYERLIKAGHTIIPMEFDAGFGAMSNAIVEKLERDFLLIGSDDFDFKPAEVRKGIEELVKVLGLCDVDIAAGRVNGIRYEFDLIDEGEMVKEVPVRIPDPTPWFVDCDLAVNYCLIKKRVFEKVRWEGSVKIGGAEHGAFFLKCKRAGFRTVFVPGVNINEQKLPSSQRYKEYRRRANNPARPCFDKLGVKKYIMASGRYDYCV